MSDDIHFNYIYALIKPWFYTEDEARRWYKEKVIPAYSMTTTQIVEQLGRGEFEKWIEAKKLGCFE